MKGHEQAEADLGPFGLRVYQSGEHRWTWRYVDPEAALELDSNTTFPTRGEAADSARRAYPGVPFVENASSDDPE